MVCVVPQETLGDVWTHFWLSLPGGCPWHLEGNARCSLNILQCAAAQLPTTKSYLATNVDRAKAEK